MAYGAPYGYNGYIPQYQQQMAQYPQQQMQQQVQQPVQSPQHIVRPVASIEEARAVQTDFNGALTMMPDTAHGFVYTKQLNLQTGCADFNTYQRVPPQEDISAYVTRKEFDEMKQRFNLLCEHLGGTNNEHDANADAANDRK